MTFEEWFEAGVKAGFCFNRGCWTHGWEPEIDGDAFDQGFDECVEVIQVKDGGTCES